MKGRMFLVLLLLLFLFQTSVSAEEPEKESDYYDETFSSLGGEDFLEALPEEILELLQELGITNPTPENLGRISFSDLLKVIGRMLKEAAAEPKQWMTLVLVASLFGVLFWQISSGTESLRPTFLLVFQGVVASVIALPVSDCILSAAERIKQISSLMKLLLPSLTAVLLGAGQSATAAISGSFFSFCLTAGVEIFSVLLIPYLRMDLCFALAGGFGEDHLCHLLSKIRKGVGGLFTGLVTLLIGLWNLQKSVSVAADSVALRTGKAALSGMIPVVGGSLSEALAGMSGCVLLVKSCMGGLMLLTLFFLFFPLFAKVAVSSFVLWAGECLSEALGAKELASFFGAVMGNLRLLLGVLAAVFAFLLLTIGTLLSSSMLSLG
ncbi:MAG: hypothetical protein IJC85_03620 [Oscillospiraceae bacterium]|nr:hypothetical protein [Oscillospiraceae bacterium]